MAAPDMSGMTAVMKKRILAEPAMGPDLSKSIASSIPRKTSRNVVETV